MKIEGAVALVTGANRGIGRAIVDALLEANVAKVYAAARDTRTVPDWGPRVVPIALDTTNPDSIATAAARAKDVTLLVNNAGVFNGMNLLTTDVSGLEADFRTNVLGTLAVTRAFVPVLEGAREGTIVNILSLVALASLPAMGGYAASKAAAYSVTQAVRAELRSKGISVLAALPGPVDTDMVRHIPMAKASPVDTAKAIVAGIARGDEEIFPDAIAEQLGAVWRKNPKAYEQAFANWK